MRAVEGADAQMNDAAAHGQRREAGPADGWRKRVQRSQAQPLGQEARPHRGWSSAVMMPRSSARPLSRPIDGIARLRPPAEIVEDVLAVVGPHGDGVIRPAGGLAAPFLGGDGGDQGHHVGAAAQMLGLVEGAADLVALALDVAQMEEMHPVTEALHHAGQVVVRPGAERARAERDAVGGAVDRLHHRSIVGLGRHDPRQAEEREGRVVRMTAEPNADLLGNRHDRLEKGGEVGSQRRRRDGAVLGQMLAQVVERHGLGRARQAEGDIGRELLPLLHRPCRRSARPRVARSASG